jgi:hypothetical protein
MKRAIKNAKKIIKRAIRRATKKTIKRIMKRIKKKTVKKVVKKTRKKIIKRAVKRTRKKIIKKAIRKTKKKAMKRVRQRNDRKKTTVQLFTATQDPNYSGEIPSIFVYYIVTITFCAVIRSSAKSCRGCINIYSIITHFRKNVMPELVNSKNSFN